MEFDGYELLEVAYVAKIHGLKGFVSIKFIDNFSSNILSKNIPVFLDIEGIPVPFSIEEIKKTGNNSSLLKLKYIDTAKDADKYKFCSLYIRCDCIEKKENITSNDDENHEYYGYEVFDSKFGYIGKITNFNFIPGNPVFETNFDGKTIIIPYNEDIIMKIDDENKKIEVKTPDGLVDLYL